MTLRKVADQIVTISVHNRINGQKYYVSELYEELKKRLESSNRCGLTVTLRDGDWFCLVVRWGQGRDGYDYYLFENYKDKRLIWRAKKMTDSTWKSLIETMKGYITTGRTIGDYDEEAGWEDWMNEYTEAADGEPASEAEIREIERIEQRAWDVAKTQLEAKGVQTDPKTFYWIYDDATTAHAAVLAQKLDKWITKEDARREAEKEWEHLTPREQEARDGFELLIAEEDEYGCLDLGTATLVWKYK